MKISHFSFIIIALLFANSASAIRCNSKLANKGDSQYKFLKLCGEPDFVEKSVVYRTASISSKHKHKWEYHTHDDDSHESDNQRTGKYHYQKYVGYRSASSQTEISHEDEQEIQIEEWTYDFGPRRLVQKVRFVDGIAVEITSLGYGFSR
ncbi:DUF2845 domain-containing protein [Aliikangiella coralliicola]|uniref:DUF2845 domain-containing protein n=1 Tax=Aliikangiella coralliicola TaxID=2592383 RepID=UPI00143DE952|nr:DUF2845 domain-containing protein [Aliikangiella coralliicola]